MDNQNGNTFRYTYSAREQEEIQKIRKKYITEEHTPLQLLKELDKSVTRPGAVTALILGILGALIMGAGMCICMLWSAPFEMLFFIGIAIGSIGIVLVCIAYPIYSVITAARRKKIAPQILSLTDELTK